MRYGMRAGGSTIEVSVVRESDCTVFRVDDDGGGVHEDLSQQVFLPFTQLHKNLEGFGL